MAITMSAAIESLLAPLTPGVFAAEHLGRLWRHFEEPAASPLAGLLDWSRLEDMLATMRVDPRRVALLKAGQAFAPEHYLTPSTGLGDRHILGSVIERELSDGATLMVGAIDEWIPALGHLAHDLESWLHTTVSANLYLADRDTPGLRLHWDDHDTFILQLAGRKRWTVHRPTIEHPLRDRGPTPPLPAPGDHVWQGVLDAGSRIYLPRGWWHLVEPIGERTAHVTVGWNQPDGLTLIGDLLDTLSREPVARQSVPYMQSDGELRAYLECLSSAVAKLLNPACVSETLRQRDARRWKRDRVRLRFDCSRRQPGLTRIVALRPPLVMPSADGALHLTTASGMRLRCDDATIGSRLAGLTADVPVAIDELTVGLTTRQTRRLRQLVTALCADGSLATANETPAGDHP
jgi:Cupin superfamily protein